MKFTDKDVLNAAIFKVLTANLETKSPAEIEMMSELSNQVVAEILELEGLTVVDQIKKYHELMIASRQITYVLGCGIASHWELSVKLLAEKLKIQIFESETSPNRKSPMLREIEPIIEDIKSAAPKLAIKLTTRKNLRDALVHGNFHQLKTSSSESQTRETRERLVGSVVRIRLSDQNIQVMNEIK